MIAKWAGESRLIEVDFSRKLASAEMFSLDVGRTAELLSSATATEVGSSDLTLSDPAISSAVRVIGGRDVVTGQAVSFTASGGTRGTEYRVRVEAVSDAGQTLIRQITLRVI